jgi:hypothetical protein
MRIAVFLILSAALYGAEITPVLESVSWDLKVHKLVWTVRKGSELERYEINPDTATISSRGEERALRPQEAALLHRMLDRLSISCAEKSGAKDDWSARIRYRIVETPK